MRFADDPIFHYQNISKKTQFHKFKDSFNPNWMNDKTIRLYSFYRFDKSSGIYYLKCICGAITPLRPEDMNDLTVSLKCSKCYLTYNIKMSCEL